MQARSYTPAPRGFHGDTYLTRLVDHVLGRHVLPRAGTFLETGANIGSTLGDVVRRFPELECVSCEPDAEAFAVARRHAVVRRGVRLLLGTSQELMGVLDQDHDREQRFTRPLLAWLDAHGYGFEWPLRDEIRFVTERFSSGFLLIDDFRVPGDPAFGWDQYQGHECSFDYVRESIADGVAYRLYYPGYTEHTSPWHPLRGWGLVQFGARLDQLERLETVLPDVCRFDHEREALGSRSVPSAASSLMAGAHAEQDSTEPRAGRGVEPIGAPSMPQDLASPLPSGLHDSNHRLGSNHCLDVPASDASSTDASVLPSDSDSDRLGDRSVEGGPECRGESRAVSELRARLEQDDRDATAWNDLAVHLAHGGDLDGAVGALGSALALEPDHRSAGANLKDLLQAARGAGEAQGRAIPVAPGAWGRMVPRDAYADLAHLVDLDEPIVIDGGANRGDTVARLRRIFPGGHIHAFEPNADLAAGIRARFGDDPRLVVHAAALAEQEGVAELNVFANDRASSLLEASDLKRRYQGARVDVVDRPQIIKLRLDRAVPGTIDVVKLDVQGYELEALAGLGARLADVRALLLEVEFASLFDGQPLFGDVDAAVRASGFRLFNLYDLWTHPDGQMTSGDALYLNERFYA